MKQVELLRIKLQCKSKCTSTYICGWVDSFVCRLQVVYSTVTLGSSESGAEVSTYYKWKNCKNIKGKQKNEQKSTSVYATYVCISKHTHTHIACNMRHQIK